MSSPAFSGPVADFVHDQLSQFPVYRDWRARLVTVADYVQWLEKSESELRTLGLTRDEIYLSARFPENPWGFADGIIEHLAQQGACRQCKAPRAYAAAASKLRAGYRHERHRTYIFPEEGAIAFALAAILRPAHILVLGSYYGYWAVWAALGAGDSLATITLIDPDEYAMSLAAENFARLGLAAQLRAVVDSGIECSKYVADPPELILLDAEGIDDDPDPMMRGKRIYSPLARVAEPVLGTEGVMLAHNILLDDATGATYFREKARANKNVYRDFLSLVERRFPIVCSYATTEGVGVYARGVASHSDTSNSVGTK